MNRRHRLCSILWLLPALAGAAFDAHDARACGGCFHPPPPPNEVDSVVTEHRMAFAMSTTQSVLWDQIRYSGNPKEFAWVLPVQPGTQVQLSTDAWLAALDANTETIIRPPPLPHCPAPPGSANGGVDNGGGNNGGGDQSAFGGDSNGHCSPGEGGSPSHPADVFDQPPGSGGCGCLFGVGGAGSFFSGSPAPPDRCPNVSDSNSSPGSGAAGGASLFAGSAGVPLPPPVTVQTRETVGPYDVVILRSSMGEALDVWLLANGFEIPPNIQRILDAYVAEKLDFVAMKLRPGANVNSMRPVRVVEPGADPNLPLRMIAAGAGANVGLTLWVISEGRYQPQNFPSATIDFSQLVYDVGQRRSNYTNLRAASLSGGFTDAGADSGTDAERVGTDAGTDAETDAGTEGGATAAPGYWLTEFAGPAQMKGRTTNGLAPGLLDAYAQACVPQTPPNACDAGANDDGGADGGLEAGDADGASDVANATDVAADATQDANADLSGYDSAASEANAGCTLAAPMVCDDPQVAFSGLHMGSIWITRLVADLPSSALGKDLVLEATPDQSPVANMHEARSWVDGDPCHLGSIGTLSTRVGAAAPTAGTSATTGGESCTLASKRSGDRTGACAILGATALAIARWKRRRQKVVSFK